MRSGAANGCWRCSVHCECLELEIPDLRLHDLRHTHASFLINAGRSLFEVQNILGHSTPQMTQRYDHLSTETLQEAANSASKAFDKAIGLGD
ncbi:MAG: tyrosine-type recombinase/integrase [Candidatus Marinimicrobia bacterium]|nr:tyrosine-type recombinase/integrase [Candidatus Neomarinimicrobiota bacterium]